MPKTARNPEDIEAVKEIILDAALDIIFEQGFNHLSMRKIALRTSMTAANIYNYYSNKDEIYLAIQTRGFSILYDRFRQINQYNTSPMIKLEKMVEAYFDFGFKNPDQYEIMFTRNTPKYADYVGTKLEPAALIEKNTALQVADLTTKVILEIIKLYPVISMTDARYRMIRAWTTLHGVVSLYNSRVLQEVDRNTEETVKKIAADIVSPLSSQSK